MAVSRRLRFEILRRDAHACRYCGAQAPDVQITVDHVIPVTLGGGDEPSNLVTACQPCNAGKSSIPADATTVADVEADALRWAEAMRLAAAYRAADRAAIDAEIDRFDQVWSTWYITGEGERAGERIPRDENWRTSVARFIENGLSVDELAHLVTITMDSQCAVDNAWRYFCGCAWRALTEMHETARLILEVRGDHRGS